MEAVGEEGHTSGVAIHTIDGNDAVAGEVSIEAMLWLVLVSKPPANIDPEIMAARAVTYNLFLPIFK